MIKTDIKEALINYHMLKRAIKIDQDNLTVIRNMKSKIGGSVAKLPQNPISRDKLIISNMDKEDFYLLELTNHEYKLFIVNKFIDECSVFPIDVKQFVVDLYIKRMSINELVELHQCKKTFIYKKIDEEIESFVNRMNQ